MIPKVLWPELEEVLHQWGERWLTAYVEDVEDSRTEHLPLRLETPRFASDFPQPAEDIQHRLREIGLEIRRIDD